MRSRQRCRVAIIALFAALLSLAAIVPVIAALPDIDVVYISRTPRYDKFNVTYVTGLDPNDSGSPLPTMTPQEMVKRRWPGADEIVTFTAKIKNPGQAPTGSFTGKWYMDGVVVKTVTLPSIPVGGETTTTYQWMWDSEWITHTIKFVADPDNQIQEEIETNNSVEDPTNALSYRFHVWQALYNWFRTEARKQNPDLGTFEDWCQLQMKCMNQIFKEAVYPATPNGILERVRVDEIVIEPDGTADPDPGACHAPADLGWDGRWGFKYEDYQPIFTQRPDFLKGCYTWGLHEHTHQLGMLDLYQMDLDQTLNHVVPISRSNSRSGCVMATSESVRYSDQTACAFNANLHRRRGYYGEYLYDVPNTCKVRLLDAYYRPIPNATIKFYQDKQHQVVAPADFTGVTDANGCFTMPNRDCARSVTTATGHKLHPNPWGMISVVGFNEVFFCEITANGKTDYQYFDILPFNVAFRSGHTDSYTYNIQTTLVPEGKPTNNWLRGIKMASSTLGYSVGDYGTILKWDGQTWTNVASPVTEDLHAVDIHGPSGAICVAGSNRKLLVNTNGTWVTRTIGTNTESLTACAFADQTTVIIGSALGNVYRTTNMGQTYSTVCSTGTGNSINAIRFADSSHGILTAINGKVYITSNGGVTWTQATGDFGYWGSIDCAMPSVNEAYVMRSDGGILRSTDGCVTWQTCSTSSTYPNCMDMTSGGYGWALSWPTWYSSEQTINRIQNNQTYRWYDPLITAYNTVFSYTDVSALSANEAWAVGGNGGITHLVAENPDTFTWGSIPQLKNLPDGTLVSVTGAAASGSFPGSVYVQTTNRSSGLKVLTNQSVQPGQLVQVTGILDTDGLERIIRFGDISATTGTSPVNPVGVTGRSIKSSATEPGLVTSALLVRVSGTVTGSGSGWFTVDDGSGKIDSEGNKGVKVTVTGMTPPDEESFVRVTGICSFERVSGKTYPLIRARGSDDIQTGK